VRNLVQTKFGVKDKSEFKLGVNDYFLPEIDVKKAKDIFERWKAI